MRPQQIKILGIPYSIMYCDNPSDVDIYKRNSLWGQCDYWTRTIRIYDGGRTDEDIYETIIHEILHAIGSALNLEILDKGRDTDEHKHEELDVLALAITDVLFRNEMLKF